MARLRLVARVILLCGISAFIMSAPFSKKISKTFLFFSLGIWLTAALADFKNSLRWRSLYAGAQSRKPILIFFAAVVISTLCSLNPYYSQQLVFSRYAMYVLVFLLGYSLAADKKSLIAITGFVIAASLVIGAGGVWDQLSIRPTRLYTCFGTTIYITNYVAMYIPLLFALVMFSRNTYMRSGTLVVLLLSILTLIFALSRITWLACVLTLLLMAYIKSRRSFLIAIILLLAVIVILPARMQVRGMTIVDPNTLARVELWDRAVKMFRSSPITGVGPGMFGKLIYDPKFTISIDPTVGRIHAHAHNTFLELLAETGLLGFCAYMYIFAVFFIGFFRSLKKGIDGLGRAVLVGIAGGVLATLILSLGTTIITVDLQDAVLFWLLAGVGFQLSKKGAHESEAVRP